jgi:alkylhydroperoxidase family enzyme
LASGLAQPLPQRAVTEPRPQRGPELRRILGRDRVRDWVRSVSAELGAKRLDVARDLVRGWRSESWPDYRFTAIDCQLGETMASQRISYVPLDDMTDEMRAEMERCAREGTPRPESSAVRAHVPAAFWFFADSWDKLFRNGVCDHAVKELCRVYISRMVKCEYCGNQRSEKAKQLGLVEGQYDELLNFESSPGFTDRQRAALAYAEAIAWHLDTDDEFWERMHRHFTEPELVELGCAIGLTMGQQSWLRLLNIEHHQVMAGTTASMAPGFETPQALGESKTSPSYWARA